MTNVRASTVEDIRRLLTEFQALQQKIFCNPDDEVLVRTAVGSRPVLVVLDSNVPAGTLYVFTPPE